MPAVMMAIGVFMGAGAGAVCFGMCAAGGYVVRAAGTKYFAEESTQAAENGELFWIEGATYIELYYVKDYVKQAVRRLTTFFKTSL